MACSVPCAPPNPLTHNDLTAPLPAVRRAQVRALAMQRRRVPINPAARQARPPVLTAAEHAVWRTIFKSRPFAVGYLPPAGTSPEALRPSLYGFVTRCIMVESATLPETGRLVLEATRFSVRT